MAELSERDARLVARMQRSERPTLVWACVLMLLGMSYATWGALRFDPRADIEAHMSFDRPVSALGELYAPYAPFLRLTRPTTDTEALLLAGLKANMAFSVGVMITLMRVFLGILLLVKGMVALSVRLERRRLLDVIARMQSPPVL
jgi:hypothetical protein